MVQKLDRAEVAERFGPCVRYGSMTDDEKHPCFFCGYPIPVITDYCECGIVKCPSCGSCACTINDKTLNALLKLRDKYCCNAYNFVNGNEFGMIMEDGELLKLVPHYTDSISYCRAREWSKR